MKPGGEGEAEAGLGGRRGARRSGGCGGAGPYLAWLCAAAAAGWWHRARPPAGESAGGVPNREAPTPRPVRRPHLEAPSSPSCPPAPKPPPTAPLPPSLPPHPAPSMPPIPMPPVAPYLLWGLPRWCPVPKAILPPVAHFRLLLVLPSCPCRMGTRLSPPPWCGVGVQCEGTPSQPHTGGLRAPTLLQLTGHRCILQAGGAGAAGGRWDGGQPRWRGALPRAQDPLARPNRQLRSPPRGRAGQRGGARGGALLIQGGAGGAGQGQSLVLHGAGGGLPGGAEGRRPPGGAAGGAQP